MKTKHLIKAIFFALAMAIFPITSCNNSDDSDPVYCGEALTFDKNVLTFDHTASSETIEILNAKEWVRSDCWGIHYVTVLEGEKVSEVRNPFVIEKDEYGNSFNVFEYDTLVGKWFSVEKQGAKIIVKLDENNGSERKLRIQINAASNGEGEVCIKQKGK